jgi:hypothetical protein
MRKVLREIGTLSWTVGGVGLVLITLSGPTLAKGYWIAGASLACHFIGVFGEEAE